MAEAERSDEQGWHYALANDELWQGEMRGVRVASAEVLLIRLGDDEIHAYANRCPHASSPLHDGLLQGATLRCPWHFWQFDARTGIGINPRNCALRRYAVKVVDNAILVHLNGTPGTP